MSTTDANAFRSRWSFVSGYHCFGCASTNPSGLRLEMLLADDALTAPVVFGGDHASYPGVVHGGIVLTALDEVMGNLLVGRHDVVTFTVSLRARFLAPVLVGSPYQLVARMAAPPGRLYKVHGELWDVDGVAMATAEAAYAPISDEQARRYLALSGDELTRFNQYLEATEETDDVRI